MVSHRATLRGNPLLQTERGLVIRRIGAEPVMENQRILLTRSLILLFSLLLGVLLACNNSKSKSVEKPASQDPKSKTVSYEGMVLIPQATFVFKNKDQSQNVSVRSFYVDQYEVTVGAFMNFLKSAGYRTSASDAKEDKMFNEVNSLGSKYAVGFVSLRDATAYCRWSGKRLPTPQEWQLAALGTDGREWPWGVWSDKAANIHTNKVAEVGSFPQDKSPYGVFDMGGNVLEWTPDGSIGGSYVGDNTYRTPTNLITSPDDWVSNTGFRCAADVK